jgi:hypothetical protein
MKMSSFVSRLLLLIKLECLQNVAKLLVLICFYGGVGIFFTWSGSVHT